ncbi:MAG TPA: response regulator transcription factor [Dehalococcoidia bacterium]|nr:response regulator transcription factor [Dehalococcoidia bacterium]
MAVESPAGISMLVVSDGRDWPDATAGGLEKLGWMTWRISPADVERGDVASRPPEVAVIALSQPLGSIVNTVQNLDAEAPGLPMIVLSDDPAVAEQALFAGAIAVLPWSARASLVHAQLRAVLRHAAGTRPASEPAGILRVRSLKVDSLRCEVTANHRRLDLTPTEYRILHALVKHAGRVLGADFLLQQAAGVNLKAPSPREIVKVHVARLRRKLFEATGEPDYIVNVRNVGYLLERRRRTSRRTPDSSAP